MANQERLFYETLSSIPDPISDVLEQYSGITKKEQKKHILTVRNGAYKAHPYPCLGRFRFLELDLSNHPLYESYVLPAMRKLGGPIFLDLGTCLGQDIRKLIYDGVDPSQLYGSDILYDFINSGYELFQDETKMPREQFLCPADVFDKSESNPLRQLYDKVDILHATAVFHLFDQDQQLDVARQCLRLLKKGSGTRSLILGGQVGNVNASETMRRDGRKRYRHSEDSWRQLWDQVREEDEFKDSIKGLEVDVQMQDWTRENLGQSSNRKQMAHIGLVEEGFRWQVWQVWVQF